MDSAAHDVGPIPTGRGADMDIDSSGRAEVDDAGCAVDPDRSRTLLDVRVESRASVDALHAELVAAGDPRRQELFDACSGARHNRRRRPRWPRRRSQEPRDPGRNERTPDS
jgi:hypothetical protein